MTFPTLHHGLTTGERTVPTSAAHLTPGDTFLTEGRRVTAESVSVSGDGEVVVQARDAGALRFRGGVVLQRVVL